MLCDKMSMWDFKSFLNEWREEVGVFRVENFKFKLVFGKI